MSEGQIYIAYYGDGELHIHLIMIFEFKMNAGIMGSIACGAYGYLMGCYREVICSLLWQLNWL